MFLTGKQYPSAWEVPQGDPPLKKTRDYYHFKGNSWNDPYRSSKKMSKFYHKTQTHFNENYDETEFQRQKNREEHEKKKDRVLDRRDIARERLYQRKLEREVLQLKSNQRPIIPEDRQAAVAAVIKQDPDVVEELTLARSKTFADPEKYNKRNSFNRFNDLPTKQLDLLVFPEIVDKDTDAAKIILQRHQAEDTKVNVKEVWCQNHRDEMRQSLYSRHNRMIELEKKAGVVKPLIDVDPTSLQESTIPVRSNSPGLSTKQFSETNSNHENKIEGEINQFGGAATIDHAELDARIRDEYLAVSGMNHSEGPISSSVKTSQDFKQIQDLRASTGFKKSDSFAKSGTVARESAGFSHSQRQADRSGGVYQAQLQNFVSPGNKEITNFDDRADINLYEVNLDTEEKKTEAEFNSPRATTASHEERSHSLRGSFQKSKDGSSRSESRQGLRLGFTRPKTYSCSRRLDRLTKPKEAFVHPNPYAHSDFSGLFIVDFNDAISNSSYNIKNPNADTSQFLSATGNMKKVRPKSSQLNFPNEDPYKITLKKKKKKKNGKTSLPGTNRGSPVSKLRTPSRPMTSQSRLDLCKTNMRDHLRQYTSPQFMRTYGNAATLSERQTLEVDEEQFDDSSDILYSMKELDRFDQRNMDYQRKVGFSRVALEEALKFSSGNFRKNE